MLSVVYFIVVLFLINIFAILSIKKNETLFYIFSLYFILTTYEWISNNTLRWNVLFINLNIVDIFCLYLLLVTAFTLFINNKKKINMVDKEKNTNKKTIIVLMLVFAISLIRGILSYGYNVSVQEDVRRFIEAWVIPLACVMYYPINLNSKKVHKALKFLSSIIILFCLICWSIDIVFGVKIMNAQSDAGSTMRVLRPEQAVLVSMLAIYFLDFDINRRENIKISIRTLMLCVVVILLQHRTAWATLATGLLTFVFIRNIKNGFRLKIKRKLFYQIFFIIIVSLIVFIFLQGTSLMNSLKIGIEGFRGERGGTLDYRLRLWKASLNTLNKTDWIFGKPFGTGYIINLGEYSRNLTPHNAYIQSILRVGIVGLFFILNQIFINIVLGIKNRNSLLVCICVMILTMWIGYTYNFNIAFFYGMVLHSFAIKEVENKTKKEEI